MENGIKISPTVKNRTTRDQEILFLGVYPKNRKITYSTKFILTSSHCNIIYSKKNLESTQMSANIGQRWFWYVHITGQYSVIKEDKFCL